jgi:hypothetical protein
VKQQQSGGFNKEKCNKLVVIQDKLRSDLTRTKNPLDDLHFYSILLPKLGKKLKNKNFKTQDEAQAYLKELVVAWVKKYIKKCKDELDQNKEKYKSPVRTPVSPNLFSSLMDKTTIKPF